MGQSGLLASSVCVCSILLKSEYQFQQQQKRALQVVTFTRQSGDIIKKIINKSCSQFTLNSITIFFLMSIIDIFFSLLHKFIYV